MKLSLFIQDNMEAILGEWEAYARTLLPAAKDMTVEQLRDHAQQMLETMAEDLKTVQSEYARSEKSQGRGVQPGTWQDSPAQVHATLREEEGFDLDQMLSEYRALRASVLRLWTQAMQGTVGIRELDEMTRFNEAIDQALAESSARFNALLKQDRELYLAVLGHDLRTPLATILMSANALSSAAVLNDQYRIALTRILASGTRMKQMINELLDFALMKMQGSLHIAPGAMDLGVVAQRVVDEINGIYPDRSFQVRACGDLQGTWDEARLGQLVSNLVINAMQHGSEHDPVTIIVQHDCDQVYLVVKNQGPAIPANLIPGIYEPMKHVGVDQEARRSSLSNLGLGLYIAREIVSAHGGSIGVTSSEQEGTSFTVRLPRHSVAIKLTR